jgi:hypothetical protein
MFFRIVLLMLLPTFLTAQDKPGQQVLTVTEFIHAMRDCRDSIFILRNATIEADPVADKVYCTDIRNEHDAWKALLRGMDTVNVQKQVWLFNVHFAQRTVLPLIHFKEYVHFEKITVHGDLFLRACTFDQPFSNFSLEAYYFGIEGCRFKQGFYWERIESVRTMFLHNTVDLSFNVFNTDATLNLSISDCLFRTKAVEISSEKGGEINIHNCVVTKPDSSAYFYLGGSGFFDYMTLQRDTFYCKVLISNCSIKERLSVLRCLFAEKVAMQGLDLPEKNTNARWYQFEENKLAIATESGMQFSSTTPLSVQSEEDFYSLVKVYFQLLRSYKYNGDDDSYDACFIEMKDFITKKSHWNWQQDKSIDNFAEWQLNRFLRIFCDYGVNPGKALWLSIFIIALFGFFYLIFPEKELPFDWTDLAEQFFDPKTNTRARLGILRMIGNQWLTSCGYSMNAFVTLGYGNHGKGLAQYFAVAEGVIGWFMFSVFSASLIGQILQQG